MMTLRFITKNAAIETEVGAFENEILSLKSELTLIQNEQKATRVKITRLRALQIFYMKN